MPPLPPYRRLYDWQTVANSPVQDAMARQPEYVRKEFDTRYSQVWGRRRVLLCMPWRIVSCPEAAYSWP